MDYQKIQGNAIVEVKNYFFANTDPRLVYHNFEHTQAVVEAAREIAAHYQLNEEDIFILTVAASFHDTGYFQDISKHEEKSAELAEHFLESQSVPPGIINRVKSAILSTKLPQTVNSLIDEILCDADLFNLGMPDFRKKAKLLHQELENIHGKKIGKKKWLKMDIDFMKSHQYHTEYAINLLRDQKFKNIEKLKRKLNGNKAHIFKGKTTEITEKPIPHETKKERDDRPDKGIETMFRITSSNNQRLSDMADNKANILITVNSIVLSLIVSLLLRRLEDHSNLIIPTFILLTVSLSCIVVSIRSTRPNIPNGKFNQDDLDAKAVNLLFFGNFYRMSLSSYADGMNKVMIDKDFLYGTLIKDIYSQGVVLGRKYNLIRLAYNIFMWGLITTVIAFVVAFLKEGKF